MTDTAVTPDTGFEAPSGPARGPEAVVPASPMSEFSGAATMSAPTLVADPTMPAAAPSVAEPSDSIADVTLPDAASPPGETSAPSEAAGFTLLDQSELPTLAATATSTPAPDRTEPTEPVAEFALPEGHAMPTLPEAAASKPAEVAEEGDGDEDATDGSDHPMGHLMPAKSKPSEASRKAAELRAAKKAKGRKIKIGLVVAFLAIAAAAGPPAFSWLSNAINEAGDTSVEEG